MNLSKIPDDIIINHIIPYTYNIQPKEFLNDIKSFYNDYNTINDVYLFEYNAVILLRDLLFFTVIYNKSMINIVKKHIFFNKYTNKQIYNYILYKIELTINLNTERKIRFLIGLMTPIQRAKFINRFVLLDNIILDVDI
jgi:hypothetical protein